MKTILTLQPALAAAGNVTLAAIIGALFLALSALFLAKLQLGWKRQGEAPRPTELTR